MKYLKPDLIIQRLTSKETIASGLSEWLDSNDYAGDVTEHITTYEINS